MVGAVGIEPTTPSMSPRCSTAELSALSVQSNRNPIRNPCPINGRHFHVKVVLYR
jgi:hypothetical protein